jgi:hypothetical protein
MIAWLFFEGWRPENFRWPANFRRPDNFRRPENFDGQNLAVSLAEVYL